MEWQLRRAGVSDQAFLYNLHRTTMRDVIEQTWGWDEEWQRGDFSRRLAACDVSIIDVDGQPVGSLWVEHRPGAIHIVELQLVPTVQGQGIGTGVVRGLNAEGCQPKGGPHSLCCACEPRCQAPLRAARIRGLRA